MHGKELLTISYKGKDYTLKELVEDNDQFGQSLEMPDILKKQYSAYMMMMDFGYLIASDKFKQLYSLLASAKFALTQSHQKLHNSPLTWSAGYSEQLWIRSQYLKNAFLWYNSCDDYFLQIIWFAFDFSDPNKLTTAAKYKRVLKDCRWESLYKLLEPKKDQTEVMDLLTKLDEFHNAAAVKKVKSISNSLKHHADIYIQDLDLEPDFWLVSTTGYNSAATANKGLDIDESILLLQEMHDNVIDLACYLYFYIDFETVFDVTSERIISLEQRKDKSTYKNIFFPWSVKP